MRFALAPMISGTFVVSMSGTAAPIEWLHITAGFALIYLIFGLLIRSWMYAELRMPAAVSLVLALMEAIPHTPRLHALVSPLLFAALVWGAMARPREGRGAANGLRMFVLPGLVLAAIFYGVGYRHQTSGMLPHVGLAMLAAGVLLICCVMVNQNNPDDAALRGFSGLTITVLLFQIVAGITALVIRLLEIDGGLTMGLARTAHITGAAVLLAVSMVLAIQYRRRMV
jgi:hypothetical protein